MVGEVNINTALGQQAKTEATSTKLGDDFNQFLILLTTQLQNQDPLSPMDSTEFTNQLVAFSGVEQQINANQKLDSLVSLQLGNIMGSAIGYVGMNTSYVSSELYFDGENAPAPVNYSIQKEAIESTIRVVDERGDIIYEADGSTDIGSNEFTWNGRKNNGEMAEKGTYDIRIDALDYNGDAVGSTTVVTGRVRGVETQNGNIFLLVGERAVSLGNVLNASEPEPELAPEEPEAETPPEETT